MDTRDLYSFLKYHNTDLSMTAFFAPERIVDVYDDPNTYDDEKYNESVQRSFMKNYGSNGTLMYTAVGVLVKNYKPFQNRINGIIKDNWLSPQVFGSIAKLCVFVLNKLEEIHKQNNLDLQEWQKQLKNKFKLMITNNNN